MNPARVAERKLATIDSPQPARLSNFKLCFNKISRFRPGAASANIEAEFGGYVDGVLYRLQSSESIETMDKFESAPEDYAREIVMVRTLDIETGEPDLRFVPAWTYIGQLSALAENIYPTRDYLGHLLASPFLDEEQRQRLEQVVCIDD